MQRDRIDQAADTALLTATRWLQHHRSAVGAAALVLALGTGATAVAISRAPDPADLPVRQVLQAVQPSALAEQLKALDGVQFKLNRTEAVRASDTIDTVLARLGVVDAQAAQFLKSDGASRVGVLKPGRLVHVTTDDQGRLQSLITRWLADDEQHFRRLTVQRSATGALSSQLDLAPLVATQRVGSGTVRSTLFAATDEARMPDVVAVQMAEIFSGDIDFHRALRKGDRFHVVYEALEADGDVLRAGRVLSAEFVNGNKTFEAIWFQEPGHKGAYYTADAKSLRKAYLASPLEFSRVTSGFKLRFHPLLNKWRAHLGVDYAAPTGTPARTVGDGVVETAGWQNGYGNTVVVRHRSNHTTLYAHLSRVNVRKGQNVQQGQTVGLVGSTGWSTGPHLHFEFRVDGVHKDPLTIAKQSESVPMSTQSMPQFKALAKDTQRLWQAASTLQVASAQ